MSRLNFGCQQVKSGNFRHLASVNYSNRKVSPMSLRTLFLLAAVAMALVFVTPVNAAPLAQESVDEVFITSTGAFTLTVMIDEVTTVAIPLQVEWQALGPTAGTTDGVVVSISPSVLRTGFFSVTVGTAESLSSSMAVTLTQPAEEIAPPTGSTTITGTTAITSTTPATTPVGVPTTTGPTANAIANLREGPGTNYAIVGSIDPGTALDVVGQNIDGTWLALADGTWVAAFLVDNPPTGLPIVEPTAAPLPAPTASDVLTPTTIPTVTPTP
jgi:hypothetical protein